MLTCVEEARVTVSAPDWPPPAQVTFQVVVAVTVYSAPDWFAEDVVYR